MALVIHRSLKRTDILHGNDIPDRGTGIEEQRYVRLTTQTLFKKIKPVFNTVVFDKATKSYNIILSETYLSCHGPVNQSENTGRGVRTIPIVNDNMFVVAFKIVSVGANYPLIGFCDADRQRNISTYTNTILFDTQHNSIRYCSETQTHRVAVHNNTTIKNNDIIQFAVNKINNKLWIAINDVWYPSNPDGLNDNSYTFVMNDIVMPAPTMYVVPNGSVVEIVDYPFTIPKSFSQAISTPVLDWYKDGVFKREGFQ